MNNTRYDYKNQAWIKDGVYQRCGHPEDMGCNCYGRIHAGEQPVRETIEELTSEYQAWCEAKGYPQLSADELYAEADENDEVIVKGEDATYLQNFIERWEEAEDRE